MPICHECGKYFSNVLSHKYHIEHKVCARREHEQIKTSTKTRQFNLKIDANYDDMSRDELILRLAYAKGKYDTLKEHLRGVVHQ